jgi:hypothetical protein
METLPIAASKICAGIQDRTTFATPCSMAPTGRPVRLTAHSAIGLLSRICVPRKTCTLIDVVYRADAARSVLSAIPN